MEHDRGTPPGSRPEERAEPGEPRPGRTSGARARNRYLSPRLIEYGRLDDLTRGNGQDGFDGIIGSQDLT